MRTKLFLAHYLHVELSERKSWKDYAFSPVELGFNIRFLAWRAAAAASRSAAVTAGIVSHSLTSPRQVSYQSEVFISGSTQQVTVLQNG